MSSEAGDYSLIQDEDVLKRMWQDTEDFGRKKEIRAHMYKIREARLRDFYTNTGESETIKTTTKTSSDKMTHADSLGDHSFLSLKTKEIRDSESPTRDAYKITGVTKRQDHGWDIMETNQSSDDGKRQASTRIATTSGKKDIQGGEAKYAAKAEQKASVYQDGDDKNFTKSVGSSSHNVVKQEAHGGDDNSKFFTTSTSTSSSSQYRSEQKSTSGDFDDKSLKSIEFQKEGKIPQDFKGGDGKTRVFTETKTLPDGSTVTTTRYETVGSKSYSTTQKRSESQQSHHQSNSSVKSSNVHIENVEIPSQEITIVKNQKYVDEDHTRRLNDLKTLGRDTDSNVKVTKATTTETRSSTFETKPTVETKTIIQSDKIVSDDVHRKNTDDNICYRTTAVKTIHYEPEPIQPIEKVRVTSDDQTIKSSKRDVSTSSTTDTVKITNKFDNQKVSADNFINIERQHVVETNKKPQPVEVIPIEEIHNQKNKDIPKYVTPERREAFKPPKSEMDEKRSPTDGQYDTTYRTDYVSKKISVDVSPTHDAFVRSLRSVSPDRSRISSARSSRTPSQSSLRSSPEKIRSPDKAKSPEKYKKSKSPDKYSSTETFTRSDRNVDHSRSVTNRTDTVTTKKRLEKSEIDSSTLTRKKKPSRSPSPTTTASEIEYIRSVHDETTDLDMQDSIFKDTKISRRHTDDIVTDRRPKTLEVTTNSTTTKKKKVTERSPTSPLTDFSPRKTSPSKEMKVPDDKKKPFRRTDTYEERCKEILGLIHKDRKDSLTETTKKITTTNKQVIETKTDKKKTEEQPRRSPEKSPLKKSPEKSPMKKSPEKDFKTQEKVKTPKKITTTEITEFPSQIRKSPEKEPATVYHQKPKQTKKDASPEICEFPSQIRRSPQKEPLGPYPEKSKTPMEPTKVSEFPSQVRRAPSKEPSRKSDTTDDFIEISVVTTDNRKTSEIDTYLKRELHHEKEPYPSKEPKETSKLTQEDSPIIICEFPSQIRKSPEKEPLAPYPERPKEPKEPSTLSEFPSQPRKSPEKVSPLTYPEKPTPSNEDGFSQICEFLSQIRRSSEKEPATRYPEIPREPKERPSDISEFPSQIHKKTERGYVEIDIEKSKISKKEHQPEKIVDVKEPSKIAEFPSQVLKSPKKTTPADYPEGRKPSTKDDSPVICEFPSQIRRSPVKEPLEPYPEKTKTPKEPSKISEFPSQINNIPKREPSEKTKLSKKEPYPERSKAIKEPSKISEFPSQIRRSPEKEPLEPYPEKTNTPKEPSKISEFPSQINNIPTREHSEKTKFTKKEPYPEKPSEPKEPSKISEFPSQTRKPKQKESLPSEYPEKPKQSRQGESPYVCEFPSQIRKSPVKEPLEPYPEKPKEHKQPSKISEFPSQIRKSPENDDHRYPSDIRKTPERDCYPERSPERIADDLIKEKSPDRISLDDLPVLRTDRTTPDRVSLSDLEIRKETEVDAFIKNEKVDTEITLKKYDQKQQSKKITKQNLAKKTKIRKVVTEEDKEDETSSSDGEDEVDERKGKKVITEINVDIRETSIPHDMKEIEIIEKNKVQKKVAQNRAKKEKIEVKKVQNVEAKKQVKEVLVSKKSIQPLCKDTTIRKVNKEKLQFVRGIPDVTHKIVKKDQPEKMLPTKKPKTETGISEYTEKYTKTTNKIETTVPKTRVTTTTKVTITPVLSAKVDTSPKKVEKKIIPKPTPQKAGTPVGPKLTKTTIHKTIEAVPSNRHVVSTIINLKPKISKVDTTSTKTDKIRLDDTKTIHKTTVTKTVTSSLTNQKVKPKPKVPSSRIDQKKKLTVLTNGHHIPTDEEETDQEIEIIEKIKKKTPKQEKKCITTKSILIENAVADEREIIVDLKRSKSSREGTPDRICPYPVTIEETSIPRYPDRISEPEETVKMKKVTTEIIHEDTEGFDSKIREVTHEIDTTDECLLTVNEKVNKFLTTAEEIVKPKEKTAPTKVERQIYKIDQNLEEDDCLLSVSDKVSKFITTAEELTKPKTCKSSVVKEDVDIKVEENDESLLSVSEKVSHFIATAEKVKKPQVKSERTPSPEKIKERSPSPRKEQCLKRERSLTKEEILKTDETFKKTVVTKKEDTLTKEEKLKKKDIFEREQTLRKDESLWKEESLRKEDSLRKEEVLKKDVRRESLEIDTTPKTSRRSSKDEPKTVLSPTGRLRSTETIKKAKALFENINKEQEIQKQRDIFNRPSVFDHKRKDVTPKEYKPTDISKESKPLDSMSKVKEPTATDDEEIPHYMTPLDRTIKERETKEKQPVDKDEEERYVEEEETVEIIEDLPHYMLPLDRSLRERSPHKESVKQIEDIMYRSTSSTQQIEETDARTTKFGVTLRRTDSGRMISTQKAKVSTVEKQEEINIEEIFDLEYLEKLLETIVGYDIRRRIRTQIRIVKKMIEDGRTEIKTEILKKVSKSPTRESEISNTRRSSSVEHQTKTSSSTYSYVEKSEEEHTSKAASTRRSKSPTGKVRKSPEKMQVETKKVFQTELKKTQPIPKKVVEVKPDWITQKTLKKVSDTPIKRSSVITTVKKTKTSTRSEKSPSKEITDVITSSYGVGPLDENGAPLFGLKALKAQNKSEKTKVQGTVIRSQYYSENGEEPVGEISVTKYSSDPNDLENNEFKTEKGISSVTTTQKFGYKGTPSLKTISGKTKAIESEETSSSKTTKVTRRGSVKEISQKFIENAVDTLKSERKTSFPKAGLILRTSSFKERTGSESPKSGSSREASPGYETRTTVRTVKTSGGKVDTFLTNKSKVTGVQDVITRMKNEEVEGESIEDIEAKNLLNKFIGSQVLLSGMESIQDGGKKTVTKITTSVSESGQPAKTVTRTFTHPITPELLKTVWDQQTLNLLLEQSTDYEDRRIIRTRLREIMAEQEACADLVEKATDDMRQESRTSIQERTFTQGPITTSSHMTSRVTTQQQITKKPMSPFAKFRQLDKQNSLNSPPSTPKTPTGSGSFFKFTDPTLSQSANTIKQRLLQWCQRKTMGYENIQLDNFSTSWADGMAFCALIHHFLPEAFDYNALNPKNRRHNFTLAFQIAEDKAGIAPLLDVDDMVAISKPDWKCVFTYVQSIYRRFKDED